jgi:hypothetical protein
VVAWLALAAPVLPAALQLGDRDTSRLYYPVKQFFAEGLRRGELRFWDPQAEAGVSLLGQVTPGLLHPFTLLYLGPFDLAFKLNHLVALLLGGAGAFLLSRKLGCSPWAALSGGIAFGGSGALVSAASSNLPFALGPAAVPLALAGLLHLCERPSPLRLLAGAAALSLCAYGGDPQSLGFALLLGVLWAAFRKALRPALLWAAAGLLLAAPVALPALVQLQRSTRAAGVSAADSAAFSTSPARLLGLVVPQAFDGDEPAGPGKGDTFSEYLAERGSAPFFESILFGAPALLLALAGGRRALFPLLAGLVLALGAAGDALPVHALLSLVPGFRLFRFAEKLIAPACCLFAVAAALGAERALREGKERRLLQLSVGLLMVLLFALLGVRLGHDALAASLRRAGRTHDPALAARFLGALETGLAQALALSAGLALVALVRGRRNRPALSAALAAGLCAVSALLSPPLRPVALELLKRPSTTGALVQKLGGGRVWADASGPLLVPGDAALSPQEARLIGAREALWPQLQALDGLGGVAPYFSAPDARYVLALQSAQQTTLRLLGVRFEALARGQGGPPGLATSESGVRVLERPVLPRAFIVHRARVAGDETELAGADLAEEALVEAPLQLAPGSGVARVALDEPGRIDAEIETGAPGLLVVGEHFDPGWTATIDGAGASVIAADFVALGVAVPPGRHRVALRFSPRGLAAGLACATALALLLVALSFVRRTAK